jgi:hypothetical protein
MIRDLCICISLALVAQAISLRAATRPHGGSDSQTTKVWTNDHLEQLVDESGAIYEKDLGPNTTKTAEAMTTYDPDSSWHKTE